MKKIKIEKEHRLILLDALERVRKGEITTKAFGICYNVIKIINDSKIDITSYICDAIGKGSYPLGGHDMYIKHMDQETMWKGYQRKIRMKALDDLIKHFKSY